MHEPQPIPRRENTTKTFDDDLIARTLSLIDTVLRSGFSNLKKRHLVGQPRVAVLSSETVPVPWRFLPHY